MSHELFQLHKGTYLFKGWESTFLTDRIVLSSTALDSGGLVNQLSETKQKSSDNCNCHFLLYNTLKVADV
jgi:hypothetical protein